MLRMKSKMVGFSPSRRLPAGKPAGPATGRGRVSSEVTVSSGAQRWNSSQKGTGQLLQQSDRQ